MIVSSINSSMKVSSDLSGEVLLAGFLDRRKEKRNASVCGKEAKKLLRCGKSDNMKENIWYKEEDEKN